MAKHPKLTFQSTDSDGHVPDLSLINQAYIHTATGGKYVVTGYVWDATTDLWRVTYADLDDPVGVKFSRTIENFNTPGRFTRVVG